MGPTLSSFLSLHQSFCYWQQSLLSLVFRFCKPIQINIAQMDECAIKWSLPQQSFWEDQHGGSHHVFEGESDRDQCWSNIWIFKYIQIYLDEYVYLPKYLSLVLGLIYSDCHLGSIYPDEYIRHSSVHYLWCPKSFTIIGFSKWLKLNIN